MHPHRSLPVTAVILFWVALGVGCRRADTLSPGELRTYVVHVSDKHLGFPGAVRLRDGTLLVAFREGSRHVSPDGAILLSRSRDNGRTWTRPDTIVDTIFDDRDASLAEIPGGIVLLNFFALEETPQGRRVTLFLARSADAGKTWSEPLPVHAPQFRWIACSDNVLALPTGRLLLPAYGDLAGDSANTAFVLISEDQGMTWNRVALIARDSTGRVGYNEPALVLLPDRSLLCVMRTAGAQRWMAVSYSFDWGASWTPPTFIDVQGEAPDVLLTQDRFLVLGYRDFSPRGVSLSFSFDGGRSWERERPIYAGTGDLAYPSLVELPDRRLVAIYYADQAAWRFGYPDKRAAILAAHLSLDLLIAPSGFSASYRDSVTVSLRWNRVPSAHYYRVLRTDHPDSLGQVVTDCVDNGCLLRVDPADTLAYYRVLSVFSRNEGGQVYRYESAPSPALRPRRGSRKH
ncbi:MAG: glycoside hydrolase [candidate division KSB1 bacterium]|nr:glycoside hydrolase [candidate division KSB1 bacterium]